MRLKPVLFIGIAVSLIAGALVTATSNPPARSPGFPVPVGNVGDVVVYERFERADEKAEWRRVGNLSFWVENLGQRIDEHGGIHDSVYVRWTNDTSAASHSAAYIDLASRDVLARESRAMASGTRLIDPSGVYNEDFVGIASEYGPVLAPQRGGATDTMPFWLQGRTLAPGQDLSALSRVSFENLWGLTSGGKLMEFRGGAREQGSFRGASVLELEFEGRAEFEPGTGPLRQQPVAFLSAQLGDGASVSFSRRMWVSPSTAYPLWIQDTIASGGQETQVLLSLASLAPGGVNLPFDASWNRQTPRAEMAVDRSPPDQSFPSPGTPTPNCLRLAEALDELETGSDHTDFRLWRATNQPNFLIGFKGECWGPSNRWTLVYGTPTGTGYVAWVEPPRALGDGQRDDGPVRFTPFETSHLLKGLVTIEHVETQWERFVEDRGPEGFSDPTALHEIEWGYSAMFNLGPFHYVTWPEASGTPFNWTFIRARGVQFMGPDPREINFIFLDVDARTGLLIGSREGKWRHTPVGPNSVAPLGVPASKPSEAGAQGPATGPYDLLPGTLVSGGLLALWLAIYFFPVLKYAAAQGLTLVPGYAKLRRDRLLDHKLRDELVQHIRQDPGISATELAQKVTAGWSTVVYHLGVIEKNNLVTSFLDTRHRRFFPVGEIDFSQRGRIAVMKNERTRRLFDLVQREPGQHQGALARALGISLPGAAWHLRRLEQQRLIRRVKEGRTIRVYPDAAPSGATPFFRPDAGLEVA